MREQTFARRPYGVSRVTLHIAVDGIVLLRAVYLKVVRVVEGEDQLSGGHLMQQTEKLSI